MKYAPIVLFVYNRLDHTIKTVDALQKNYLAKDSELFIFSDGYKGQDDITKVNSVRNFIKGVSGFKSVKIIEQEKNIGLAESIVNGVTKMVNEYGKVIVLEDDIVTSKYFLKYMNDALDLYENDEQVMHVSGYFFPVSNKKNIPETFLYQQTSCWGWGTWKKSWEHFNSDANYLMNEIRDKNLEDQFNIDGTCNSFMDQLIGNVNGTLKTWAIKWQASVFLNNGLSLHPKNSFTKNIGNDGTGTNVGSTKYFNVRLATSYKGLEKIPIEESVSARNAMKEYYSKIGNQFRSKLLKYIKKIAKYTLFTIRKPNEFRKNLNLLKISLTPRFTLGDTTIHGELITFVDSASFMYMNEEIFYKKIYAFKSVSDKPYIIDGGANIGLATIFFKKMYPNSEVVAFEPDSNIFKVLQKNLNSLGFDDVKIVEKGLWTTDGEVSFFRDGSDGGRINNQDSSIKIKVTRLRDYLNRPVDFLKLDIEGSEVDIIEDCKDLLVNIKNIFVEYHSFANKKQDLDIILNIFSNNGFRYYIETVGPEKKQPFINNSDSNMMDMQLNIFATKK